jgi:methionine-rich copper-binding protein CopC
VAAPPERVEIWFTQELFRRAGENWIRVFGPGERPSHVGEAQIDDDDRTHLWVMLEPGLESGQYRVEWRSLSAEDGDTDQGNFHFTLDPQAGVTSTPMPAHTPTAGPIRSTPLDAAAAASPTSGTPGPTLATGAVSPTSALPAPAGSRCGLGLSALVVPLAPILLRRLRS